MLRSTLYILLALLLSCNTTKRRTKRVDDVYRSAPVEFLDKCSEVAAPKIESTTKRVDCVRTQIVPGDVVYVDCDSILTVKETHSVDVRRVPVPCPPTEVLDRWHIITDTFTVENTAAVKSLAAKLQASELDLAGKHKGLRFWRKLALILSGIVAIYILLRVSSSRFRIF